MIKKEMPRYSRSCSGQKHRSNNSTHTNLLSTGLRKLLKEENIILSDFGSETARRLKLFSDTFNGGLSLASDSLEYKYIFIDETTGKWEYQFIFFHELGHHLLGHLKPGNTLTADQQEIEANMIASVIVALKMCKEYDLV